MENDNYDVFISYRRKGGKHIARNVQLALEKENLNVFLDFDEIEEGRFDSRIMSAIENSSTFLIILSPGALDLCINEDDWVRKEILYAHQLHKDIIPVEVDKCYHDEKMSAIPKNLSEIMGAHQFSALDTEVLFKASIDKLIVRIQKKLIKEKKSVENNESIYYFQQKGYLILNEIERHDVYKHYFDGNYSKAYSRESLFPRMLDCVKEMYAFHSFLNYNVDYPKEDWLLSEWLIDTDKVNMEKLNITAITRRDKTKQLSDLFSKYRNAAGY